VRIVLFVWLQSSVVADVLSACESLFHSPVLLKLARSVVKEGTTAVLVAAPTERVQTTTQAAAASLMPCASAMAAEGQRRRMPPLTFGTFISEAFHFRAQKVSNPFIILIHRH
jgi:hypothetical protein